MCVKAVTPARSENDELTLPELARAVPGKPHPSTLYRWISKGISIGDRRIRLEARRHGGRLRVRLSAYERFVDALSQADLQDGQADATQTMPANKPAEVNQSASRNLQADEELRRELSR